MMSHNPPHNNYCKFPLTNCTCSKQKEHVPDIEGHMNHQEEFITKDSGERRKFESGAQRDVATGKGRYDLISPIMIDRLAKLLERGAVKYNDRNWEKGMPLSVYMDSGMRHLYKFLEGHRDEDHLIAAIWNFQALLHIEEMVKRGKLPKDLYDLPNYTKECSNSETKDSSEKVGN